MILKKIEKNIRVKENKIDLNKIAQVERYNFKIVEKKWQDFWDQNQTFKSRNKKR